MLRLKNLSNKFQKRTLRVLYGQTQAYPYAAVLHSSLRASDGSFDKPLSTDTVPITRSADAYTLKGGLIPGTVMVKEINGEEVFVAAGGDTALRPFGLLANFVGGDMDELGDENEVGVWRGVGSVVELLKPAFDDTGLAAAAGGTQGTRVPLYAGTDGRLVYEGTAGNRVLVAELIERVSASRIIVELKI